MFYVKGNAFNIYGDNGFWNVNKLHRVPLRPNLFIILVHA